MKSQNIYFRSIEYLRTQLPAIFEDYFTKNEHLHNYNPRSASNLHIGYQRTDYGKF